MINDSIEADASANTRVLWRIKGLDMTMGELCARATSYRHEHPDTEVFMDGDLYAVVARRIRA